MAGFGVVQVGPVDAAAAEPVGESARTGSWSPWGALALFAALRMLPSVLRLPEHTPDWVLVLVAVGTAFAFMALVMAALAGLVRIPRSPLTAVIMLACGIGAWVLGFKLGAHRSPAAVHALWGTVQDLGLAVASGGLGWLMARGISDPNILVPVGAFAAYADFVVVKFGTVHNALQTPKGAEMVAKVSAKVPSLHPGISLPTVGPADFLFLGALLALAVRFDMGLKRNAVVLTVVLAISLLLVSYVGPVPALAPMMVAFLATNWRRFKLSRDELLGTALVLVVAGGLFLFYFLRIYSRGATHG